jgi:hypothetical protein
LDKTNGCGSINHAYFLCLIDWETKILSPEELKDFTNKIIESSARTIDDWKIKPLSWPKLADIISNVELGFYHSRLIFKFDLGSALKDISQIREIRKKLESKIEDFCIKKVIPHAKPYIKEPKEPHIFIYPIFELNIREHFWRFEGQKPYSLPTTCFFTKLDDPEGKSVKMRISGAKIVASNMSEWFFNNLVNIVFHEGLYRQTRKKDELPLKEPVYKGLENRLEDFASKLMTTFHEYSSEYIRRKIQKTALAAAIIAGVFTFISLVVNLWKLWNP